MSEPLTAWTGDWRSRITSRLEALGCTSLCSFLQTRPHLTYDQIASELGKPLQNGGIDVAAAQIQKLQFDVVDSTPTHFVLNAKDSLVRILRQHLKKGWGCGTRVEFQRANAKVAWIALVSDGHSCRLGEQLAQRVWTILSTSEIPQDWLPFNLEDEIIQHAFDTCDATGETTSREAE